MDLLRLLAFALAFVLASTASASAQLSPGKLSRVHADLEGVSNCSKCHSPDQGIESAKCLDCHAALRARVRSGRGLHARDTHRTCEACHVEHQGREFQLVYWKGGEASFDHALTGHRLEGRHTSLTCRECHRAERVQDPAVRGAPGIDPGRTFLGLSPGCASCHGDPHAGDLGAKCADCHGEERWKPASGFDHAKTRFPLEGLHRGVECARCHRSPPAAAGTSGGVAPGGAPAGSAGAPSSRRFRGLAFSACSDCHNDPHGGRFQETCASCHTVAGWKQVNASRLDHDRTRFPLRGRHASVACAKCHAPGRPMTGVRFAACSDCHGGFRHEGRFLTGADGAACDRCHVVDGFRPAVYTLQQHASTRYPLEGAHRAVACPACHAGGRRDEPPAPPVVAGSAGGLPTRERSLFACADCHANPHGVTLKTRVSPRDCESCHVTTSWRAVRYDHALTGFVLTGRHATVACIECHPPERGVATAPAAVATPATTPPAGPAIPVLTPVSTWCADCHPDVHRGQFTIVAGTTTPVPEPGEPDRVATDCSRCHTPVDWLAERFEHDRDSRYRLDGAHARVRCTGCHPAVVTPEGSFVRYKPLDTACESCHDAKRMRDRGSP